MVVADAIIAPFVYLTQTTTDNHLARLAVRLHGGRPCTQLMFNHGAGLGGVSGHVTWPSYSTVADRWV